MMSVNHQRGLSVIEFTVLATALLLMVFGVIEVGRYVYSLQVINEITRKAARLAVVCPVTDAATDRIPTLVVQDNAPFGFTAANLQIEYLDLSGNPVNVGDDGTDDVRFVRVSVTDYQHQLLGFFSFLAESGLIQIPNMQTVLPVETLGYIRPTVADPNPGNSECIQGTP
jgi:Flp pilus assembly protein TadG